MKRSFSRVEKFNIIHEWEINEITSLIKSAQFHKEDIILKSSKFSTNAEVKDSWFLKLRLNNAKSPFKGYISAFLETNNEKKEIRTTFSLYILNNKREKKCIQNSNKILGNDNDWGYGKYIEEKLLLDNKDEYLPSDILTLCIDLTVYGNYKLFATNIPLKNKRSMIQDYKKLFHDKVGSDISLLVQDQKFSAHKGILIARSPVFAAMFIHKTIENKRNEVTITDLKPEIIEKMLEYIYTDEVIDFDSFAEDLLEVADKYQIQSLKEMCEESICKLITVENAIKRLILADRHSAHQLLEYVTEFIVANAKSVIETEDFKSMDKSNSFIFSSLFTKMATTYCS